MKKLLFTTSLISFSLMIHGASAQNSVVLSDPNKEIIVQGQQTVEPQLIPIQLITDPKTGITTARLAEVQATGTDIGINRMMIEGRFEEKDLGAGKKEVNILWDTASLVDDKTGEKKTTLFSIPFVSKVVAKPELEGGDQFNAEGNPIELMLAYQRLTQQDQQEEEEEEEKDTTPEDDKDSGSGGGADEEGRETDFTTPDFAESNDQEPVTATETCGVRVDISQMAAIVQERVLVNGVAESECEDTLTRYPLEKKYNSCPLVFDTEAMQGYEQFVLVYNDPNDGEVQAQGCTQDDDNPIQLTENFDSCSIRHDFAQGLSFAQSAITYTHQGAEQTLQDCQDSDISYPHTVTRDGCDAVVANGEVTFQEKTTIDVDGIVQTILDCQPNPETSTTVEEEICTTNRYTHDFDSNQSHLNKTYYYMDGEEKVIVQNCVASDVTFAHQEDETQCSPTHDDTAKTTTMNAKTFIEETAGNKTYISSCHDVLPSIPYVKIADRWSISSSNISQLIPQGSDNDYAGNMSFGTDIFGSKTWFDSYRKRSSEGDHWMRACGKTTNPASGGEKPCFGNGLTFTSYKYCTTQELANSWVISGGITLNQTNSTDEPSITQSIIGCPSWQDEPSISGYRSCGAYGGGYAITINCPAPTCLHTHLKTNPVWQRGDMSEYIETSVVSDNMHVCGNGSNLDGTDK